MTNITIENNTLSGHSNITGIKYGESYAKSSEANSIQLQIIQETEDELRQVLDRLSIVEEKMRQNKLQKAREILKDFTIEMGSSTVAGIVSNILLGKLF